MKKRVSYLFLGMVILLLLYTCDLFSEGYGDKADLSHPELTIDGVNGGYINGSFTLEGTVEDDIAIRSVVVDITNYVTNETDTRNATVNDSRWALVIDTISDDIFSDGEIEFVVTAKDTSDKSVNQKRLLFVDNMKPTVLINTPDQYGINVEYNQKITIKGETKDFRVKDNTVKLINNDTGAVFSVEADKTPSWSAVFDTESLGMENGSYYLLVESEDMAGNINDYFYHFSDTLGVVAPNRGATVEELASSTFRDTDSVVAIRRSSSEKILLSVNPDSDKPNIVINAWTDDNGDDIEKEFKGEVRIDGTITDDDGIESITIELYDKNDSLLRSETLTLTDLVKNKQIDVGLSSLDWGEFGVYSGSDSNMAKKLSKEGKYSVRVIVKDINQDDPLTNSTKKSRALTKSFRIDGGFPALTVDKVSGSYFTGIINGKYVNDDFTISGTASDGNGVAVKAIFENQVNGVITEYVLGHADEDTESVAWTFDSSVAAEKIGYDPLTNRYSSSGTIDLVSSTDYEFLVTISAFDGVKETEKPLGSLIIDVAPPTVDIELPSNSSDVNGSSVKVVIRSQDPVGIDTVDAKVYFNDGGTLKDEKVISQVSGTSANWVGSFDSTLFSNSTNGIDARIVAYVTDKSGNRAEAKRNFRIDQSKDIPVFTFDQSTLFNNPSLAGKNLIESNAKISGSIKDDDKVKGGSVYLMFHDTGGSPISGWIKASTQSSTDLPSFDWRHDIGASGSNLANGVYGVSFKAKDENGIEYITTTGTTEFYFAYDTTTPTVAIDPVTTFMPDIFALSGEAEDGSDLAEIEVTVQNSKKAGQKLVKKLSNNEVSYNSVTKVWSSISDFDLSNSSMFDNDPYFVTIKATDIYGKSNSVRADFNIDRDPPVITIYNIFDDISETDSVLKPVVSGDYTFEGESSDSPANVDVVEYRIYPVSTPPANPDAGWNPVQGTVSWSKTIDTTTLAAGDHMIEVRATDRAGNKTSTPESKLFSVDQGAPVLLETLIGEDLYHTNSGYTLKGTLKDDYEIVSLTVDGTDVNPKNAASWSAVAAGSAEDWEYPITAPGSNRSDSYTIVATDKSGRTTTITRDVIFDKTKPTLTISSNLSGYISGSSFNFKGTSDKGAGTESDIDYVQYQVTNRGAAIGSWVTATGTDSWNKTFDLSSVAEGEKTLHVRAFDKAGNESAPVSEDFDFDQGVPTLEITTPPASFTNGSFTIKGKASDSYGLLNGTGDGDVDTPDSEYITINVGTETLYPAVDLDGADDIPGNADDNTWSLTYDLSGKGDKAYSVDVKATDKFNRESITLNKVVQLDEKSPIVSAGSITPVVDTNTVNGIVTFNATISDENGLEGVQYRILPGLTPVPAWDHADNKDFGIAPYSVSINTKEESSPGNPLYTDGNTYYIHIVAKDKAGNIGRDVKEVVIDQTSDIPRVNFSNINKGQNSPVNKNAGNPLATTNLFTNEFKIVGTLEDDDKVDIEGTHKVQISVNNTNAFGIVSSITGVNNSSVISWSHTLTPAQIAGLTEDGNNYFIVRAYDDQTPAVELVSEKFYFYVDKADPSLVITDNKPTQGLNIKDDLTLEGTVSDSHLDSVEVFLDGSKLGDANVTGGTWTYNTTLSSTDGYKNITVIATDDFDKTTSKGITILYDKSSPNVVIDDIFDDITKGTGVANPVVLGDYTFQGTADDGIGSLVKEVEYRVYELATPPSGPEVGWNPVQGTTSWSKTIDTTALSGGKHKIEIRAIDNAGNKTAIPVVKDFTVDQGAPVLLETLIGEDLYHTNSGYSLKGTLKDDYEIVSLTVDGTDVDPKNAASWSAVAAGSAEDWEYPITAPGSNRSDSYTIVATDKSGRTTTITRDVIFDETKPTLNVYNTLTGYISGTSYTFNGGADKGVGTETDIDYVQYQVTNRGAALGSWITATGKDSWNSTYDLSTASEGEKTLHIRAFDKAGNESLPVSEDFDFDQGVPTLEITTSPGSFVNVNSFTIAGKASDSYGLLNGTGDGNVDTPDSEYITINVGTETLYPAVDLDGVDDTLGTADDNYWTLTYDLTGKDEKAYPIEVKATDKFNRESMTLTKTVQYDKTKPVVSITNLVPVVDTNKVNGIVTVNATASDENGLEGVKYWVLPSLTSDPNWDTLNATSLSSPYKVDIDTASGSYPDGDYKIHIIAKDKAGNDFLFRKDIIIDQTTDIPRVSFSNIVKELNPIVMDADPVKTKNLFTTGFKIIGSIEDDDAVNIESSNIQINPNNKGLVNVTSVIGGVNKPVISWDHTFDEANLVHGDNIFVIEAFDINGTKLISDEYHIFIDKDLPTVNVLSPDTNGYINGAARTTGQASDGTGLKSFTITADNTATSSTVDVTNADHPTSGWGLNTVDDTGDYFFDESGVHKWDFSLDHLPDDYRNRSVSLVFEATDNFGKVKTETRSITVDTDAPTLTPQYPVAGTTVTGRVTIRGIADDVKMKSVMMKLPGEATYSVISGTYNWSHDIEASEHTVYSKGVKLDPGAADEDSNWTYTVSIKAIDEADNERVLDHTFIISPNEDKPVVSITTPDNNATIGGAILIVGTAVDNEAVKEVKYQIDVDGDGSFTSKIDLNGDGDKVDLYEDEAQWHTISNFSNSVWQFEINKSGLLYSSNINNPNPDGEITINVIATDIQDLDGVIATRTITLDDTYPFIDNFRVLNDEIDVSGDINLLATITDNDKIMSVDISYNGGDYINISSTASGTFNLNEIVDSTTPIASGGLGLNNDSDIVNIILRATDNTTPSPYQTFASLQLNVDNRKPVSEFTGNTNLVGSSDKLEIKGTYDDPGTVSSFGKVEVYVVQGGEVINLKTGAIAGKTTKKVNNVDIIYPADSDPINSQSLIVIDDLTEQGFTDNDGDKYFESIKVSSGKYNWSTIIDSSPINEDPATEVHYISYDKAGNMHHNIDVMVTVGSDLNGNGSVETGERIAYPTGYNAIPGKFYIGAFGGSKTGYNLVLKEGATEVFSTPSGTTEYSLTTTGWSGNKNYTLEIVGGATKITKNILVQFVADSQAPVITMDALEHSKAITIEEDDTKDYYGYPLGHLEIPGSGNKKVSGLIRYYGTVTDDTRIETITADMGGNTVDIAKWVGGTFTPQPGVTFVKNEINWLTGHKVEFYYDYDSSLNNYGGSGPVGTNVNLIFRTTDFYSGSDSNTLKVDIVPYVLDVETVLFNADKKVGSTYGRTALGKYPVADDETIKIVGFNLNGGSAKINGKALTDVTSTANNITGKLDPDTTSGEMIVTVNTIESINNDNTDNSYNSRANTTNNKNLTDDLYFDVYNFVDAATPVDGLIKNPNMRISPNGKIGFSFRNSNFYFNMPGKPGANNNLYSHTVFSKNWEGFNNNIFAWDAQDNAYGMATSGDTGDSTNIAVNLSLFTQKAGRNASALTLYDAYQKPSWGDSGPGYYRNRIEHMTVKLDGNINYTFNGYRFPSMDMVTTLPDEEVAVSNTNKANLYIVYYDDITKQIRYRYGTVGAISKTGKGGISDSLEDIGTRGSQNKAPVESKEIYTQVVAASGTTKSSDSRYDATTIKADKYTAIGVVRNALASDALGGGKDVVVIAWHDSSTGKLMISYNDDPRNLDDAVSKAKWQTNAKVVDSNDDGVEDISMTVDSDGGIHISYFSTNDIALKYAYMSKYDSSIETAIVDSYQSVGTYSTIDVAKVGSDQVPYISYYTPSKAGYPGSAKVAYRVKFGAGEINGSDSRDFYTGNWEISAIPSKGNNKITEDKVNVGVYADKTSGALTAIPEISGGNDFSLPDGQNTAHNYGESGKVGGNGTTNPVISYATEDGVLKMAQKK